jgi:quercetin dioxygenase-like cupin family protein
MHVQERTATVLQPGEGRRIWVLDALHIDKLTGEETNGGLFVLEARVPPGGGPPPHIHHAEDEIFYVLQGAVTFFADGVETEIGPGGLVHIPRGVVHTFRNSGATEAMLLVMTTPAGLERYFTAVGTPAEGSTPPPVTEAMIGRVLAAAPAHSLEFRLPEGS